MNIIIFNLLLFMTLMSCRLKPSPTDYNITVAPQSGANTAAQTDMNIPVLINYSIDKDSEAIELELIIVNAPKNGVLSNCHKKSLSISCLYTPNQGFFGVDEILFKTKDGDFVSEKASSLKIKVNQTNDTSTTPPTFEDIVQACEQMEEQSLLTSETIRIDFPASIECDFNDTPGVDVNDLSQLNAIGNGPRLNEEIRARVEQYKSVSFPASKVICDIDFIFPEQEMFYDDEVILTFDNYVVMSSQNYATNSGHDSFAINGLRVTETGLVEYNWLGSNGLYGLPYISNLNSRYCLGLNPSMPEYNQKCHIPETDTQGQISLDIPSEEIIKLGIASQSPNITMGFITTGDNDNGDCEHSAYSFNLNIQYFNK